MHKQEGVYRLRLKDFIPVHGLDKYVERCARQTAVRKTSYNKEDSEENFYRSLRGSLLLGVYNTVILFGAFLVAVKGLESLLSK
jgi:hypothetical protein